MLKGLSFQDFKREEIPMEEQVSLDDLLRNRYGDEENRFSLFLDGQTDPSLTAYVKGELCALYYTNSDGDLWASVGNAELTEVVDFQDDYPGGPSGLMTIACSALISWEQGHASLTWFAETGERCPKVHWERL